MIIAIDGPSGAGKSTLGRMLARELKLLYIDTGSMYRAVALAVLESSINADDDIAVGSLAERLLAKEHEHNPSATYEETLEDITDRDRRDTTRADSPLVAADDAIVIDSSGQSIEEVFQRMITFVREKADSVDG